MHGTNKKMPNTEEIQFSVQFKHTLKAKHDPCLLSVGLGRVIQLSLSRTCLISKVKMTQQTREEGLGHSTCQGNKVMSLHWVNKNYKKNKK